MKPDWHFEKKTRLSLIAFALIFGVAFGTLYQTSNVSEAIVTVFADPEISTLAAAANVPGIAELSLMENTASPVLSGNWIVNGADSITIPASNFLMQSTGADSVLSSMNVNIIASGTKPITIYLYGPSGLIQSRSISFTGATSTIVSFNFASSSAPIVAMGSNNVYTIKLDFPSNTVDGSRARVRVAKVLYRSSEIPDNRPKKVAVGHLGFGNIQYLYTKASSIVREVSIRLVSKPGINVSVPISPNGTTTMTAYFPMTFQAVGGNVLIPNYDDFEVVFAATTSPNVGPKYIAKSKSIAVVPNNNIPDGSIASVTVTASANPSVILKSGMYIAYIKSIKIHPLDGQPSASTTVKTKGLGDLKTDAVNFTR